MFISPINSVSSTSRVSQNRSAAAKTQNVSTQPSFKQANYAKVFNEEYNRFIGRAVGDTGMSNIYKNLRDAALKIQNFSVDANFYTHLKDNSVYQILMYMDGFLTGEPIYKSMADWVQQKGLVSFIELPSGAPILNASYNGLFKEDNALSKLIRKLDNRNPERRDFGLVFSDPNSSRVIAFGLDYDGDQYICRTDLNHDKMDHMETFYMYEGRIKEEVKNGILERYNKNGSKWDGIQWATDDVQQTLRNTVKLFTGWNL